MGTLITFGIILIALLGTPLFTIIGGSTLYMYSLEDTEPALLTINIASLATKQILVAIPLFTFAGYLIAESKSPLRIIKFARAAIGWFPGGLAIVALLACAVFTAFTGASGVTIIALGGILYSLLVKENYGEDFSLGHITASGSAGILIFPSVPLILYSIVAETSFDKLKNAAILPWLILIICISTYCIIFASKRNIKRIKFDKNELLKSLIQIKWELAIPVIVFGGIYGGFVTAAESAALTALYTFILVVFIHKDISIINDIPKIVRESMSLVGGILLILGCSLGLTNYLIDQEVPDKIFKFMQTMISNKYLFLFALNIFLLIVGCMMDIFSAIMIVVPIIIPVANAFDINPLHLGIIFLTNLEIGYTTPPVGLNLFISSYRFEKPLVSVYSASLPFLVVRFISLILITYIPWLSLAFV